MKDYNLVNMEWAEKFNAYDNGQIHYRLYEPEGSKPAPLVFYLHGGGESGDDNLKQITINVGPARIAELYPDTLVFAPQTPVDERKFGDEANGKPSFENMKMYGWTREFITKCVDVIKELIAAGKADPKRIYVTGAARGGGGALLAIGMYPELFAAAAPICPRIVPETLQLFRGMKNTKLWISIPYADESLFRLKYIVDTVLELKNAGNSNVHLTIYSPEELKKYNIGADETKPLTEILKENHHAWVLTYNNEYGILDWLMSQKKEDAELFTRDYLKNKMHIDHAISFDRLAISKKLPQDLGAETLPNGDIILRVYAPEAKSVIIQSLKDTLHGVKRPDGVFELTLKYNPCETGPRTLNISVDGTPMLSPYLPIYWTEDRPCNFVEVPDTAHEFALVKDVPHGAVVSQMFYSKTTGDYERCYIYTPPGYMKSSESYPVLYLQNGSSDNETSWVYSGRVAHTMDNLIAEGKAVPFIIVMNNAMLRAGGEISNKRNGDLDRIICEDCLPFIEENYRVKTDKWNRAIAGLSMGAYLSNDIGFRHPELFGYMGGFTASMTTQEDSNDSMRPYHEVLRRAKEDLTTFSDNYRVFYRSTTVRENHFEYFEGDDALCADAGIDKLPCYTRRVYSERTSKWSSWRMGIRDFAQLIFK